ncbi:MAG: hypothetical protein IT480_08765 [Gammaproteobacteria bacterium]|nr:hypothetical protein [Gammaproteobacteria bacterium]
MSRCNPAPRHAPASFLRRLFAPLFILLTGALTACGGGGGEPSSLAASSCGATACGSAVITLTDAPGDFLSYSVDIVSLQLQRDDGTMVETLPLTTTVDFARLVDLTEVISARQIPPGRYVAGSVTLDYASANRNIVYDDGSASGLVVNPVDGSGAALGSVTMQVQLDRNRPLLITAHTAGHLAFDFDLLASNTVDTTAAAVTVNPVLVASVVPPDSKDLRVRGPLVSTDTAGNTYTVTVRPFYSSATSQGEFTVHVTTATSYEIDGVAYSGAAGLAQLQTLPAGTLTAAFGTLTIADRVFSATRVLAGTSVENSRQDGIAGVVVARSGNTLSVRGATLERRDGRCGFDRRTLTVSIDAATGVTRAGQASAAAIGDISVGQRIHAFGTFAPGTDAAHATLDATGASGGRVRLEVTSLWGLINGATPGSGSTAGSVAIDLMAIEARPLTGRHGEAVFDFAGTGLTSADDAAPDNYLIDTGILPIPAAFVAGAPARFFGFVAPFGTAAASAVPPVANFTAVTLVDYAATNAWLKVSWPGPGVTAPFVTPLADTGLTLGDLSSARRHSIGIGRQQLDLTSLPGPVQIVGATGTTVLFAIAHESTETTATFAGFSDFVAALATALDGSNTVEHVIAQGTYDAGTRVFTAKKLAVVLED